MALRRTLAVISLTPVVAGLVFQTVTGINLAGITAQSRISDRRTNIAGFRSAVITSVGTGFVAAGVTGAAVIRGCAADHRGVVGRFVTAFGTLRLIAGITGSAAVGDARTFHICLVGGVVISAVGTRTRITTLIVGSPLIVTG